MGRDRKGFKLVRGGKAPLPNSLRRPDFPISTSEIEYLKHRMGALEQRAYEALFSLDWGDLRALATDLEETEAALIACKALAGIDG